MRPPSAGSGAPLPHCGAGAGLPTCAGRKTSQPGLGASGLPRLPGTHLSLCASPGWGGPKLSKCPSSPRELQSSPRCNSAAADQGPGKPRSPGNSLNVKVPRRSHTQGHGLPEGSQAHLLPQGLWPSPSSWTQVTAGGAGSGLGWTAGLLLPVPEAQPVQVGSPLCETASHHQHRCRDADPEAAPRTLSAGTEAQWQATPRAGVGGVTLNLCLVLRILEQGARGTLP